MMPSEETAERLLQRYDQLVRDSAFFFLQAERCEEPRERMFLRGMAYGWCDAAARLWADHPCIILKRRSHPYPGDAPWSPLPTPDPVRPS